ncbi:hypothetical protein EDB83DRAFT_2238045 [Lactarius deliciosus]|nr:hypothetical protein EDB83DRAFT_2238045 [Lactarius deliciosus]
MTRYVQVFLRPLPRSNDLYTQSLAVADKALFWNCLVAMRPKLISKDLPSTHNVMRYIHNKFVQWLQELKDNIMVSRIMGQYNKNLTNESE